MNKRKDVHGNAHPFFKIFDFKQHKNGAL